GPPGAGAIACPPARPASRVRHRCPMLGRLIAHPAGGTPMRRAVSTFAVALACSLPARAAAAPSGPALVSPAARPSDAAGVVRRYLEATGGAAAFAAESTSYTHAKLSAFGFEGAFSSWSARPARRYSLTELGPFKLSEGVDGITAWRTDPTTGVIRPLADHDLDQALESAWFENERWAEPGAGGGKVQLGGHEKDSLGTYTVLEVTAPDLAGGGRPRPPRQLWFDDKSGLLAAMHSKDDQREVFTRFSDYRLAAGRMRALVNAAGGARNAADKGRAAAAPRRAGASGGAA